MSVVIITGSTGLVGSEAVNFFCKKGFDVIGIDNNLRKFFFGDDGSTLWIKKKLQREGLFKEMKLRKHYEKPCLKRAREKEENIRRARKTARRNNS